MIWKSIINSIAQLGHGGPQLKANAGHIEARNPTDTAMEEMWAIDGTDPASVVTLGKLRTTAEVNLYVDDVTGNDANDGTSVHPLKTITEARDRLPYFIEHVCRIFVADHSGAGYGWPTFGPHALKENIYVYGGWLLWNGSAWVEDPTHSGKNIVAFSTAALAGSSAALVKCAYTLIGYQGDTIEILDGAAIGDRRTIKLPVTPTRTLTDICSNTDGTVLYACEWNGRIYKSVDNGVTYTPLAIQPDGTSTMIGMWNCIACSADGTTIIVGELQGRLYYSHDGGATWFEARPGGDYNFNYSDVDCSADGIKFITCISIGCAYTSSNGGAAWTERQPAGATNKNWRLAKMADDGSVALLGEYNGRLWLCTNSFVTWAETQPGGAANFYWTSASLSSDGAAMLVGASPGRLYSTVNTGGAWTEEQPAGAVDKYWIGTAVDSDGSASIACEKVGRLWSCSNTFVTWVERRPAGDVNVMWTGVAVDADGSVCSACGWNDYLYTSINTFVAWTTFVPAICDILPVRPFSAAIAPGDHFQIFAPSVKIKDNAALGVATMIAANCGYDSRRSTENGLGNRNRKGIWLINCEMNSYNTIDLNNSNIYLVGVKATQGGQQFIGRGSINTGYEDMVAVGISGVPSASTDLGAVSTTSWAGWGFTDSHSTGITYVNDGTSFIGYAVILNQLQYGWDAYVILLGGYIYFCCNNDHGFESLSIKIGDIKRSVFKVFAESTAPFRFGRSSLTQAVDVFNIGHAVLRYVEFVALGPDNNSDAIGVNIGEVYLSHVKGVADKWGLMLVRDAKCYWLGDVPKLAGLVADIYIGIATPTAHSNFELNYYMGGTTCSILGGTNDTFVKIERFEEDVLYIGVDIPRGSYANASTRSTIVAGQGVGNIAVANTPARVIINGIEEIQLEEERIQMCRYSQDQTEANWTVYNPGNGTRTKNALLAPDGTITACKLNAILTGGYGVCREPGITNAHVRYYNSVFCKYGSSRYALLYALSNGSTGHRDARGIIDFTDKVMRPCVTAGQVPDDYGLIEIGDGWFYAYIALDNTAADTTAIDIYLLPANAANDHTDYTATGYTYFWQSQIEIGESPSSPVPSISSNVTRTKDAFDYAAASFSAALRASHSLYITPAWKSTMPQVPRYIECIPDAIETIRAYFDNVDDKIKVVGSISGMLVESAALTLAMYSRVKVTMNAAAGSLTILGAMAGDGTTIGTVWSTTTGALYLGQKEDGVGQFNGRISKPF